MRVVAEGIELHGLRGLIRWRPRGHRSGARGRRERSAGTDRLHVAGAVVEIVPLSQSPRRGRRARPGCGDTTAGPCRRPAPTSSMIPLPCVAGDPSVAIVADVGGGTGW